ncbi:hypothetical protein Catovirus_1_536 [Catovirus CTV1]|uniref:Uncharacterized protein n=1 Tax=Catovirus CTV1 TaxID=1977631 RepID=A0A1V0S9U8_9VIRU|nr:hypothetical protein Catovirus_1_536 [Catovirus CTV1]
MGNKWSNKVNANNNVGNNYNDLPTNLVYLVGIISLVWFGERLVINVYNKLTPSDTKQHFEAIAQGLSILSNNQAPLLQVQVLEKHTEIEIKKIELEIKKLELENKKRIFIRSNM